MKRLMCRVLAATAATLMSVTASAAEIAFDFRPGAPAGGRGAYQVLATKEASAAGLLRTHRVKVAAPAADVAVAAGDTLTFQLFDDRTFRIQIVESLPSATEAESWIGVAEGYDETFNSVVVRTESGWQLDVQDFQNGLSYRVYTTDGVATVSEFDLGAVTPRCGSSRERVSPARHRRAAMVAAETPKHTPAADTAASTYVDILVCFDKSAQTWCSKNSTTPASFAATAVAKMNTALANTGLDTKFRYRLAGTYNVNGTGGSDLDVLIDAVWGEAYNSGTGKYDSYMYNGTDWSVVKAKRDEVGADLATVLVDIGGNDTDLLITGIGDCPSAYEYMTAEYTYSCCAIAFVAIDHTLTHEVGHNMGCDHPDSTLVNSDYISPGPGVYPYSCGYHFTAQGTKYYTIMAYNFDGYGNNYTLCPYFSSPNYSYKGVAVGNAIHDNTRTLENTYAKVAAFRQLAADKYTIKFDGNGGSSPASITRYRGETLGTLPTPTWGGHTFNGWFTAKSGGTKVTASTVASASTTYYAQWTVKQYKVSFSANGGSVSPTYRMVNYCATYGTLPTPTWAGHTFNGWFTAKTGGSQVTASTKCTGNATVYARWTVKQYKVSYNANGGSVSPAYKMVDYATAYGTLPTPTRSEYKFAGWFTAASGGTQVTASTKCTGNATIYAHWTAEGPVFTTGGDANWTKQADGSWKSGKITDNQSTWIETTVSGPGSFSFDWKVSSEAEYDELRFFVTSESAMPVQSISGERDWQTYGSGEFPSGKITVQWEYRKDVSQSAGDDCGWIRNFTWKPKEYKITYNANGGTVSPAYKMVGYCKAYGDLATPTYGGREFLGWFTAKTGGTQVTKDTKCIGNATIYAQWKMKQYKLTYNANGGTVSPAYKMVDYCATYGTLPTPTWAGHTFNGWFTAKTGGTKVTASTKCVGNATIHAQWSVKQYTVTFNANGGSVSTASKKVNYCATYGELPTPTKSGSSYLFAGWWTAPNGGTPVGYNTKCVGNATVYAQWANASIDGYKSGGDGNWDKVSEYVWNSGTGLGDNQQRWLRAEVYGSGTYSFDWSVTSQKNADFLSVYVDGVKVDAISGSTEWISKQLTLTGNYWHSIFWVYSKDGSIGQSYDCGRLAYLEWTRE